MGIVDKGKIGVGSRQFHIGVAPGEVSTVALMPGDPFRVPLVAGYLDDARDVAHQREHRTMVGTYKGREITVTSTGLGCPSTAIAVEELARVGVTSFIRVGSSAALAEHPIHAFLAAGCAVVLGNDNPITIDRTLADEERDLEAAGLGWDQLAAIQRRSVEVGFMDDSARARFRERLVAPN